MKVVNVCLNGPYTEGFTYQENLLPKYQAALGNDVAIVAPTTSWDAEGSLVCMGEMDYVNQDGIRIVRIVARCGLQVQNVRETGTSFE